MKKNEIAREVCAILSKEYGGSSKRSFQLSRSIVKLVADRLTTRTPDARNAPIKIGFLTPEEDAAIKADNTPA